MKFYTIIILCVSLLIVGCENDNINNQNSLLNTSTSTLIDSTTSQNIEYEKSLQKGNKIVSESAKKILEESSGLHSYIDEAAEIDRTKVKKSTDNIDTEANIIISSSGVSAATLESLKKNSEILKAQSVKVGQLEEKNGNLLAERDAAKQESIKSLYKTLTFFFGLGFLAIIVGLVMAYFVNKKIGFTIAGIGVLGLALAAGSIYYLKAIATIAFVIIIASLVLCVVVALWDRFKSHKTNDELRKKIIDLNYNGIDDSLESGLTGSSGLSGGSI